MKSEIKPMNGVPLSEVCESSPATIMAQNWSSIDPLHQNNGKVTAKFCEVLQPFIISHPS